MSTRLDLKRFASLDGPIVFVGFHPDDLDFHACGLAALLTAAGADVVYVVVTSGEGGGTARVREDEQRLSAAVVGVAQVHFLRRQDGRLGHEYQRGYLQKRMARLVRQLRPAVIVTFCPSGLTSVTWGAEHPDHRYGALALWDALYPDARADEKRQWWNFWRKPLRGHKVSEVLWFGDDLQTPHSANCFIEIDNVWPSVEEALLCHASQWGEADIASKAISRATRAAKRWGHKGLAEEYHHVSFS